MLNNTNWTVDDVTYISHDAQGADGRRMQSACPQIYKDTWGDQWRLTQDFAAGYKGGIYFACIVTSSTLGCSDPEAQGGPFLTRAQAWAEFWNAMQPPYVTKRYFARRMTYIKPFC